MKVRLQYIHSEFFYYKCYYASIIIMNNCFNDHFSNVKVVLVILVKKSGV